MQYPFLEDVTLGTRSLKDSDYTWLGKEFSCGTVAPRCGGIKSYTTTEDEVILEVPILWGSDSQVTDAATAAAAVVVVGKCSEG